MNRDDALEKVVSVWIQIAQDALKCKLHVDHSRTEEFEWGWVFHFIPCDPELAKDIEEQYACDRTNGRAWPVGTKGLENAVRYLMWHRTDHEPGEDYRFPKRNG